MEHFHTATSAPGRHYESTHATEHQARIEYATVFEDLAAHGYVMTECATSSSGRVTVAKLHRRLDGERAQLARFACTTRECAPAAAVAS